MRAVGARRPPNLAVGPPQRRHRVTHTQRAIVLRKIGDIGLELHILRAPVIRVHRVVCRAGPAHRYAEHLGDIGGGGGVGTPRVVGGKVNVDMHAVIPAEYRMEIDMRRHRLAERIVSLVALRIIRRQSVGARIQVADDVACSRDKLLAVDIGPRVVFIDISLRLRPLRVALYIAQPFGVGEEVIVVVQRFIPRDAAPRRRRESRAACRRHHKLHIVLEGDRLSRVVRGDGITL